MKLTFLRFFQYFMISRHKHSFLWQNSKFSSSNPGMMEYHDKLACIFVKTNFLA